MRLRIFVFAALFLFLNCSGKEETPSPGGKSQVEIDSAASVLPAEFNKLLGMEFGPENFPENFEEHTGYVMGFLEGDEFIIDHVSRDSTNLIWFCKLTHRDSQGRPFLKILDVLVLPPIGEDEDLIMGNCHLADEFNPEIIAIVKFIESEVKSEIHRAWRANREKKKIEQISVENVTCLNESFYL